MLDVDVGYIRYSGESRSHQKPLEAGFLFSCSLVVVASAPHSACVNILLAFSELYLPCNNPCKLQQRKLKTLRRDR